MSKGMVYLIHFDRGISHAQHYLGWADALPVRIQRHRSGNGAALMAEVKRRGITWKVVRTWSGSRGLERQLKNRKKARQLCPICNPEHWQTNASEHCNGLYTEEE